MTPHESKTTRAHNKIRKWAEERGGKPSAVTDTKGKETTILRIDFPDADDQKESLEEISWDEFFKIFKKHGLEFLYQEHTANGKCSRFFKLVYPKK